MKKLNILYVIIILFLFIFSFKFIGEITSRTIFDAKAIYDNFIVSIVVTDSGEGICNNNYDDDSDGLADCQDPDCYYADSCWVDGSQFDEYGLGPPIPIAMDPDDGMDEDVDILSLGVRDSGTALLFGLGMEDLQNTEQCGGNEQAIYTLLVDNDNNEDTGCIQDTYSGIEYKLKYSGDNERNMFACSGDSFIYTNSSIFSTNITETCSWNNVLFALDYEDIATPQLMHIIGTAQKEGFSDSIEGYYTKGRVDFRFVDCFNNMDNNHNGIIDSQEDACRDITDYGYEKDIEDCFNDIDDDGDGYADNYDSECWYLPDYEEPEITDITAPLIDFGRIDALNNSVILFWLTDEMANGTINFYSTNYRCESNPVEYNDGMIIPGHAYKREHETFISTLNPSTKYYYRIKNCDKHGNCGTSACFNFTTLSYLEQYDFKVRTPPGVDTYIDWEGKGQFAEEDLNSGITKSGLYINASIKFKKGNVDFILNGISIAKTKDINISDNSTFKNFVSGGNEFAGISHRGWLNMLQNLGVDYTDLVLPINSDKIYKCNDSGSNCADITSQIIILSTTSSSTTIRIPITLGFSVYYGKGESEEAPGRSGGAGGGGAVKTVRKEMPAKVEEIGLPEPIHKPGKLFDVRINIPEEYRVLTSDEDELIAEITMLVSPMLNISDVSINYMIKDLDNNTIREEYETKAVGNFISYTKGIDVSQIEHGGYMLAVEVKYNGDTAIGGYPFIILEEPERFLYNESLLVLIILSLAAFGVILYLQHKHIKRLIKKRVSTEELKNRGYICKRCK